MQRIAIIDVKAISGQADLHEDDLNIAGVYGVVIPEASNEESVDPWVNAADDGDPMVEAAKDVFHDKIGIHVLDDFEIEVRILPEGEDAPEDQEIHWL